MYIDQDSRGEDNLKEISSMNQGLLALWEAGHTAFRANVGQAWTGSRIERLPGNVIVIYDARPFRTGLPVGFSDTFGFTRDRRPFFLEWKAGKGVLNKNQSKFLSAMQRRGAITNVVKTTTEALEILD